jgi:hypothetical protein
MKGQSNQRELTQIATTLNRIPAWVDDALQGITFWIGHRRAMYRHSDLTEGAIVAELKNLINHGLVRDGGQGVADACNPSADCYI